MAKLKKCKSCEHEVSKKASKCPNCGEPLKKEIGCGALVGIVAIVLVVVAVYQTTNEDMNNVPSPSQTRAVKKKEKVESLPISDISYESLQNIYGTGTKYTDLKKDEEWKKYKGKKVKWTGTLKGIDENVFNDNLSLTLKMSKFTWTFDCIVQLDAEERAKALKLNEGDPVTVVAVLESWGTFTAITLDNGTIIEATP